MTYQEFRKVHPATRCFLHYSSETRADLASSHRLMQTQRRSVGKFYYVHPMQPGVCFDTAKQATTAAYHQVQENLAGVPS